MADVTITPRDNGPYVVEGVIKLVDKEGNEFETQERTVLCRCGQSSNKPFCDGTHRDCGFESTTSAS